MSILVWFKNDIRLLDNPALFHALTLAKTEKRPLLALTILSPAEDTKHDRSAVQVDFLLRNLAVLSRALWEKFQVPLLVRTAESATQVHELFNEVIERYRVKHLFFNNQYEVDESRRDKRINERLVSKDIEVFRYHDQVVVPPGVLKSKSSGRTYTVYTPFRKSWAEHVRQNAHLLHIFDLPEFKNSESDLKQLQIAQPDKVPAELKQFQLTGEVKARMAKLYPAGETVAHEKLEQFGAKRMGDYKSKRDFPSIDGTSGLSPYLALGVLSAKQCVFKARSLNHGKLDSGNEGIVVWIQEVIWRDFYKHILDAYPHVCMNKPFKLDTMKIGWLFDETLFQAWCEGKTGYPIVDAGMRQLNETGWMHNRVRMITASFLTKHLLHNWQLGEKYFAQHLIDWDFASNNGGWQWAASTGTDSQPYFRVFNPILQAERFDGAGEYIRRWVPELKSVKSNKALYDPTKELGVAAVKKLGYVPRIVEHDMARKRAIDAFKNPTGGSAETINHDDYADQPKPKKAKTK